MQNIGKALLEIRISRYQINVFVINMILIFVMVVLQNMHFRFPVLFSGFNATSTPEVEKIDIFETITPKLESKKNDYKLQKENSLIPSAVAAGDYDEASAYVVVDYDTGEILASKNSDTKLAVASLTKIMTAVVALDLASPDEHFVVTKDAADMIPTKIGVVEGQSLSLEELLNASLITSANDATEVIKEGINHKYSEDVFVRSMNEKAQFLGLKSTRFTNPQGLDNDDPFSTAEDLAVLSHYGLSNYPLINDIVKKDYEFLEPDAFHKQFDLYNWNGLIGVYPGVYGIKIGNTGQAGVTTIVASEREGKRVLAVLLGAPSALKRDLWASQLLDVGFGNYDIQPISVTETQLKEKYATWKYWH